jgi:hypothetical protein
MKSAFRVTIALAVNVLLSMQPNLKAATEGTTKFDGNWAVTLDAKVFKNPDGSTAKPYVRNFSVAVKGGVLHGEIGTRGKPGSYELDGQIAADGTAALTAQEVLAHHEYSFTTSTKKPPPGRGTGYSYQVVAHFGGQRGTGHSTDARPRIFTFVKES